jgi:polyphosphate kinase
MSDRFGNRELSWLDFNARVLALAHETSVPLLERVKFCGIFSSNLDEFYQVRVAALKDQVAAGIVKPSYDGLSPSRQLKEIAKRVEALVQEQEDLLLHTLIPQLSERGVVLCSWDDLDELEQKEISLAFERNIYPVLTPIAIDPAHPFPYVSNLALSLGVTVRDPRTMEERFARVKVPTFLKRFQEVSEGRYIAIEEIIGAHLEWLFPGMDISPVTMFRVTRNADLTVDEDEAEDLLQAVEMELRRRRFGRAVKLDVSDNIDDRTLTLLLEELDLELADVSRHRAPLALSALSQLASLDVEELRDEPWIPVVAGRLAVAEATGHSMFDVIRERQILVHHPYESFASSTEKFVDQAANDPSVRGIKITLYRTSGDSPIARSLIAAAERGVQVVALVELKARFDEEANVNWAKQLERAGVHVMYGLVGLKTHSKCILVVREEAGVLRRYVHIGTGNYNSKTARVYEDLGYFTCSEEIGEDVTQLFNALTGFGRDPEYSRLIVAPQHLRTEISRLIRNETSRGAEGEITIKVNALADPDMVELLYEAADAGVRVQLLVRGICCLRPGASESGNIKVRSVLGRYLEHSRIYRFKHGSADGSPLYLIGSADLMPRNLNMRVEVLTPIEHEKHQRWIDETFEHLFANDVVAFDMQPDGRWERVGPAEFSSDNDVQCRLHQWASHQQIRLGIPSSEQMIHE